MSLLLRVGRTFYRILVDYCNNASLAGIGYIFNRRYHASERLFWAVCTLTAWVFAVQLIRSYMELFRNDTISIAVENIDTRTEPIVFPAVGVCELGYVKQQYPRLEAYINNLQENEQQEYNYDVEDFLLRVIFPNLYNVGSMSNFCVMYEECDDCMKCPKDGHKKAAAMVRTNCSELFQECRWNDQPFDCCRYFQPIETTMGSCFLLNSIQTVQKHGDRWLPLQMDSENPDGDLLLVYNRAVSTNVMNEDDIPHILLSRLQFAQVSPGYEEKIYITLQNIVNDPLVRSVDVDVRRCLFPDERYLPFGNTSFPRYSYSVCVTECLKSIQLRSPHRDRLCACIITNYHLSLRFGKPYKGHDNDSVCGLAGLQCLDQSELIAPPTRILQPWYTGGYPCRCYPSCTENEIRMVGRHSYFNDGNERSVKLKLMIHPTQRYRRQIVRENIDVVVSIGGILGLFTGASVLSIVEFFYFFTVRFISYTVVTHEVVPIAESVQESSDDEHEERNVYTEIF
uniref:Sodium channel protein Nach n=1 Tax=Anopheles epiroticus TaxID=199890 RepID=A0A182PLR2_9DIPT